MTATDTSAPPKMHPCRSCAQPLREGWRYCPMCGGTRQHRRPTWQAIPAECAERYLACERLSALAAAYGATVPAVRRRLVALGVEIRVRGWSGGGKRKITRADVPAVIEAHRSGTPHAEIGARYGVSRERRS